MIVLSHEQVRSVILFRLGLNVGLSEVFDGDPWFRVFYMEIAKMYGFPTSVKEDTSKRGKIMSTYATVNITLILEEHMDIWHPWWKEKREVTPSLAEEFCRQVFEHRGEDLIPLL